MERNSLIIVSAIALLVIGGAIFFVWTRYQGFQAVYPCSLVKADDIQRICGHSDVTATIVPDALSCMYSSPEINDISVGNSFLLVMVIKPYTDAGTYEDIKKEFVWENDTASSLIVDENFVGEKSFFVEYLTKADNRVYSNKLVAFKGDSMVVIMASERPRANECNDKEKMKEIASLAISRLP